MWNRCSLQLTASLDLPTSASSVEGCAVAVVSHFEGAMWQSVLEDMGNYTDFNAHSLSNLLKLIVG